MFMKITIVLQLNFSSKIKVFLKCEQHQKILVQYN